MCIRIVIKTLTLLCLFADVNAKTFSVDYDYWAKSAKVMTNNSKKDILSQLLQMFTDTHYEKLHNVYIEEHLLER